MCPLDGTHIITPKPTGFHSKHKHKGWPKIRELNTKWLMLPRWLVSTPIQNLLPPGPTPATVEELPIQDCSEGWHRYVPPPEANKKGHGMPQVVQASRTKIAEM